MNSHNVLAIVKDSERYIFLYDDESHDALLQSLIQFATDDELSFTWHDAKVLSHRAWNLRDELREKTP